MIWVVRGFVLLAGALSVAVLVRGTLGIPAVAPIEPALVAYDRAVSLAVGMLAPLIESVLPLTDRSFGTGAVLQAHWPHVFLITVLHLMPRADATYGIAGVGSAVLWCVQAIGAVAGATVLAALTGGTPLLGENLTAIFLIAVLIAVELIANTADDVDGSFAAQVGEYESGETRREVTWRSILSRIAILVASVTIIAAVAVYYYALEPVCRTPRTHCCGRSCPSIWRSSFLRFFGRCGGGRARNQSS